jgi:hypothetical protein
MAQEAEDEFCVKVLDAQFRRPDLQAATGILEEELERVGVALDGMLACRTVPWQALTEECRDVRSNERHGAPPEATASHAVAISRSNSGVRS